MTMMKRLAHAGLVALWLQASSGAAVWAAGRAAPSRGVGEARARFSRGVDLYRDGDFAAARVEFRRAYELAPNFRVLYNLGQVSYLLHDYVAALECLSRYLGDGGAAVPNGRRKEVEVTLGELRARVGRLEVIAEEPDARVIVDGAAVGRSASAPTVVTVNVGRHEVRIEGAFGASLPQAVDVPGGETVSVRIAAPPPPILEPPAPPPAPPRVVEAPRPPRQPTPAPGHAWIGWTAAGALAAGAGVAGLFALNAARDRDRLADVYPADAHRIDDARRRLRAAALVTDGLVAGAALAAAASVYWSWGRNTRAAVDVAVGPGRSGASVGLGGRF